MPNRQIVHAGAALALALTAALAGCGSDDGGSDSASGGDAKRLKIYSSLPLQGPAREQNVAIVNGAKLALKQAGGKAGAFTIAYESLDDSTAQAAGWEPGQVSANARRAVQDDSAIAYIGEFNSGATAVSLPILNESGLLQISPGNTAVGITSDAPGAEPGEPDKYYPTGKRTYARLLPKDTVQGAALVAVMKEEGCKSAHLANDREVYGAGLARNVEIAAKEQGLELTGNEAIDKNAANYRSLGSNIARSDPDCFVYSGITANNAVQLFKDMAVALPGAKLFGPEGIGETGFFDPNEGGIPAAVGKRVLLTVPGLAPEVYPPEGKRFLEDYRAEYDVENPDRYAVYGYETMQLILDAIERAGENGGDREAVVDQVFATKERKSVLGTYGIDPNGDITLTPYGIYSIENGALVFDRTIDPPQ
ncbi:MAG: branched-chain amino acid ABC transporter substrate-binding protein [Solirubrobacteraceae bacterium]